MAVNRTEQETSPSWLARDEAALAGVLARQTEIVAAAGRGSYLIDVEGRRYLDFSSGIAVTTTGHCHPRVVAAVVEQAGRLLHTSVVAHQPPAIRLAERLGLLTPFLDDPQVFFCNSGAESVDGALKLARKVTGRPGVVAFRGGFHGRTIGGTSLTTSKARYRDGYEPLLPSVTIAPYGVLADLDAILATQAPPASIGAMVVEPVLGEGGYVVPPVSWLEGLRRRCDDHGILLVFDEVQCGIGRTGRPFAAETFGVAPDVVLFAKGVASGLPLGGLIAPRRLMERWPAGAHGSTFGGNPVVCAAALATLDVLEEEDLCGRARLLGARALERLGGWPGRFATVVDVRGVGLMIGVEVAGAEVAGAEVAGAVKDACLDRGLIVLTCGTDDSVLRLVPPLTVSDAEWADGLAILEEAMALVDGQSLPRAG